MIIIKIPKRDACVLKVAKIIIKLIWKWPLQNITKIFWRKSYKMRGFSLLDIKMYYGSTITKMWRWTLKIYDRGNTANQWRVVNAVVSTEISALRKTVDFYLSNKFSSVQFSHGRVQLFATPWTAACQASLSITNSWSILKLVSIDLVMPSNHLILCHPLLLPPLLFKQINSISVRL